MNIFYSELKVGQRFYLGGVVIDPDEYCEKLDEGYYSNMHGNMPDFAYPTSVYVFGENEKRYLVVSSKGVLALIDAKGVDEADRIFQVVINDENLEYEEGDSYTFIDTTGWNQEKLNDFLEVTNEQLQNKCSEMLDEEIQLREKFSEELGDEFEGLSLVDSDDYFPIYDISDLDFEGKQVKLYLSSKEFENTIPETFEQAMSVVNGLVDDLTIGLNKSIDYVSTWLDKHGRANLANLIKLEKWI